MLAKHSPAALTAAISGQLFARIENVIRMVNKNPEDSQKLRNLAEEGLKENANPKKSLKEIVEFLNSIEDKHLLKSLPKTTLSLLNAIKLRHPEATLKTERLGIETSMGNIDFSATLDEIIVSFTTLAIAKELLGKDIDIQNEQAPKLFQQIAKDYKCPIKNKDSSLIIDTCLGYIKLVLANNSCSVRFSSKEMWKVFFQRMHIHIQNH